MAARKVGVEIREGKGKEAGGERTGEDGGKERTGEKGGKAGMGKERGSGRERKGKISPPTVISKSRRLRLCVLAIGGWRSRNAFPWLADAYKTALTTVEHTPFRVHHPW